MLLRMALFILALLLSGGPAAANDLHFVTDEFPPFSYSRGNNAGGALVDEFNQVGRMLNYHCSIEVLRASSIATGGRRRSRGYVHRDPITGAPPGFFITPMRVTSGYDFYTRHGSHFTYLHPEDLCGRQIGVYGHSAALWSTACQLSGLDI